MPKKDKCYEIILNYSCNARCVFCSQENKLKNGKSLNLKYEEIIKLINKAKRENYNRIGFSGGEPMLRPDILQIVRYAKKTGFDYIRIQTNGLLLNNQKKVNFLVSSGVNFIKLSIHSHKSEVNDYLMGQKKSLDRTLKAIDFINRAEARLSLSLVINKLNYKSLYSYVRFFVEKKEISEFVFIFPLYTANMLKNIKELSVDYEKIIPQLKKAYKYLDEKGLSDYLFLNIPPCYLPDKAEKIIGLSAFNTFVTSSSGEWDLDFNQNNDAVFLKECDRCIYRKKCFGISKKYLEKFKNTKLSPIIKKGNQKPTKRNLSKIYLSTSEKCFLKILDIKNNSSTKEVINIAKDIPLCMDCDNGVSVINAGESLIEKRLIKKKLSGGKYYWSLI